MADGRERGTGPCPLSTQRAACQRCRQANGDCKVHDALLSHLQRPTVRVVVEVRVPVAGVPDNVALPVSSAPPAEWLSSAANAQKKHQPLLKELSDLPRLWSSLHSLELV